MLKTKSSRGSFAEGEVKVKFLLKSALLNIYGSRVAFGDTRKHDKEYPSRFTGQPHKPSVPHTHRKRLKQVCQEHKEPHNPLLC